MKVLRWHSRVPLVAPERVDDEMIAALKPTGVTAWLAVHANHPSEFTDAGRVGARPDRRCRHPDGQPDGSFEGRQR